MRRHFIELNKLNMIRILVITSLAILTNSLRLEPLKNIYISNLERKVDITGRYIKSETEVIFNIEIIHYSVHNK